MSLFQLVVKKYFGSKSRWGDDKIPGNKRSERQSCNIKTTIFTDRKATIPLRWNLQILERNKINVIKAYYIRDLVTSKTAKLEHVQTIHRAADLLTKPVLNDEIERFLPYLST